MKAMNSPFPSILYPFPALDQREPRGCCREQLSPCGEDPLRDHGSLRRNNRRAIQIEPVAWPFCLIRRIPRRNPLKGVTHVHANIVRQSHSVLRQISHEPQVIRGTESLCIYDQELMPRHRNSVKTCEDESKIRTRPCPRHSLLPKKCPSLVAFRRPGKPRTPPLRRPQAAPPGRRLPPPPRAGLLPSFRDAASQA
jgi:hypothetical protein